MSSNKQNHVEQSHAECIYYTRTRTLCALAMCCVFVSSILCDTVVVDCDCECECAT